LVPDRGILARPARPLSHRAESPAPTDAPPPRLLFYLPVSGTGLAFGLTPGAG
jgi:hypothetical protein